MNGEDKKGALVKFSTDMLALLFVVILSNFYGILMLFWAETLVIFIITFGYGLIKGGKKEFGSFLLYMLFIVPTMFITYVMINSVNDPTKIFQFPVNILPSLSIIFLERLWKARKKEGYEKLGASMFLRFLLVFPLIAVPIGFEGGFGLGFPTIIVFWLIKSISEAYYLLNKEEYRKKREQYIGRLKKQSDK